MHVVRFHLSLATCPASVKSVAFYLTLFGIEPAKLRADYAKFEPDSPPLRTVSSNQRRERSAVRSIMPGIRLPEREILSYGGGRVSASGQRAVPAEEGVGDAAAPSRRRFGCRRTAR